MPKRTGPVDLLTVPEFLIRARISRSTFYLLLRTNRGPPIVKLGGRTFIDRSAGEAWILSSQNRPRGPSKRPRMGDPAVRETCKIMRTLANPTHLLITLALDGEKELPLDVVAERSGIDAETIRLSLPGLRGVVTASRGPDGIPRLKLTCAEVAEVVAVVHMYHDRIAS